MITYSIEKQRVIINQLGTKKELFNARIEYVLKTFTDLLTLKTRWYSQIVTPSIFPAEPTEEKIHIHFVIIYAKFEDLRFVNKIPLTRNNIPSETTHIVLLDMFGRITRIVHIAKSDNFTSIFKELFGNNLINNFGDLNKDSFNVQRFFPLGWVNLQMTLLQTDQLGFRFHLEDKQIHSIKNDTNIINIAIVGGSFAAACYCFAGESFAEKLSTKLNKIYKDKTIHVWNLGQGSVTQASSLSYLINTNIINKLDYVIWVDGLNDLQSTIPAKSIGLSQFNTAFSTKTYLSGVKFSPKDLKGVNVLDRINSFTSYRRLAIDILEGLGVQSLNYLQPVCDLNANNHSDITRCVIPHFDQRAISTCSEYPKLIPYVKQIGKLDYGIEFKINEQIDIPLDFWDCAHLSPKGETQYAEFLTNSIKEYI